MPCRFKCMSTEVHSLLWEQRQIISIQLYTFYEVSNASHNLQHDMEHWLSFERVVTK